MVGADVGLASNERAADIFCVRLTRVPAGTRDTVGLESSALIAVRTRPAWYASTAWMPTAALRFADEVMETAAP